MKRLTRVEDADVWLQAYLGVKLPHVAVCPDHVSPLEVFWLLYSEAVEDAFLLANRGGGKTTLLAAYTTCYALTHPEAEICIIAGETGQARMLINIIRSQFLPRLANLFPQIINSHTIIDTAERIVFPNKSVVFMRAATLKGTNAPHPHKVIFDEVETFDDWTIIQEALNMAMMDAKRGYKAQNIFASSRKFRFGIAQKLLDTKDAMGLVVLPWCVFETMQPCESCPHNPKCAETKRADGLAFSELCAGRGRWSAGYIPLDHVLGEYRRLDPQVFDAQWLGMRPSPIGLVFPLFNPRAHVIDGFEPMLAHPIYAGVDFGFHDPTVALLIQIVGDRIIVFKEFVARQQPLTDIIPTWKMWQEYYNIKAWWCDPSRPDLIAAMQQAGLPAYAAPKIPKAERVDAIRSRLRLDNPQLLINRSCQLLISQMQDYHYEIDKRRGEPTDKLADGNDDAIDALGYALSGISQGEVVMVKLERSPATLAQPPTQTPDPVTQFLTNRFNNLLNAPPTLPSVTALPLNMPVNLPLILVSPKGENNF